MVKDAKPGYSERVQLAKIETGISGLDEILEGGLPLGRTTVISGGSGSGKTLLGMEFLFRHALKGTPGIFVGFEEPSSQIRENVATLGWDLSDLEDQKRLVFLDSQISPEMTFNDEFTLTGLLASLSGICGKIDAKLVVLDSLEVALRMFENPLKVRNELHRLNNWLRSSGLTSLMTVRHSSPGTGTSKINDYFVSMSDCYIEMDAQTYQQVSTRRLRVVKYRGSGFGRNEYPYVITHDGLRCAPISKVSLEHQPLGEFLSSGVDRLDGILGGGYRRGSCVLIAGQPGTGKTILINTFTDSICDRGEKVLYIGFEESESSVVENLRGVGVDLKRHREKDHLRFLTCYPESMGAEEHFINAQNAIDSFRPNHVLVDAISACERMGGRQQAYEYLMRLLNHCKRKGISILMTNQLGSSEGKLEISGIGISSMIDTVLFLAYKDEPGETNRVFQVLKTRGSGHSRHRHEFVIMGSDDVLTGTRRRLQEFQDQERIKQMQIDIESKELELARLRMQFDRLVRELEIRKEVAGKDDESPRPESNK